MRLILLLLLFLPTTTIATGVAHPRIWLDSATLTRLTALRMANDPTWVALKSDADALLTYSVPGYDRNVCLNNTICYAYEGQGWYDALTKLSLAYKLTGNIAYASQVKTVVSVMIAAGAAPIQVDDRYPSRFIGTGLAIAYDWCYDQLSASDKAHWTALADLYWNDVNSNGYQWAASSGTGPNGYGNYFGGHLLGMGTLALAIEDDDLNSAAMQAAVLQNFNIYVVPAFSTGGFQGGYAVESYNYGGSHFLRLFQYMRAMTTAGKKDLLNGNIAWLKAVAKNTLYEERPDLWSITDEGSWTGSYIRSIYEDFPLGVGAMLNGTTEGGWLQFLYSHLVPPSNTPPSLYLPSSFEAFLYNSGQAPIDYSEILPTYYFSPGDFHTIVRSSWANSATHTTFNGGSYGVYADHQSHSAGHISIQRGSDYLLINAGQWAGQTGNFGNPQTNVLANWDLNTMFYWDQGTNCLSQSSSSGQYAGCQMFWSVPNTVKHAETANYVFQEAPLQNAYLNNAGLSTLANYTRCFVNIGGDIDFVLDRITAPATSVRYLEWHTPALNAATPAGPATAIDVNGAVASVTLGNSKLFIKTLLPASPKINKVTDVLTYDVSSLSSTQRFEVSDPNSSNCSANCLFLTVLAPTASTIPAMPTTTLISTNHLTGALYDDGVAPRIALFSVDGTAQASVQYTAAYSSALTGRHVILDMVPGSYNVTKDGATIFSGLPVGSDGSLSFASTGGSVYAIQASGTTPRPAPPTNLQIVPH
jgi:Heparinase II C-terminal domain